MPAQRRVNPMTDSHLEFAGNIADRRVQIEREQEHLLAERRERLASQTSPLNTPEDRIRIWEQLHALQLPRAANHKLLQIISTQTDLTLAQVRDEQIRRATALQPRS